MDTLVDSQLLLEFFLTFARFEYALKATGFLKRYRKDPANPRRRAEPDWDRFSVSLRDRFVVTRTPELNSACRYLLHNPPNKQVLLNGRPKWVSPSRDHGVTDIEFVLQMTRCVRNNLFHGGKHNVDGHQSTERTVELLQASLVVLKECLSVSPPQSKAYDDAVV